MTHGSLFSGIGGFDLAAEWAGIPTRWMVERDPFCQRILRRHFPHATLYDDITTLDLTALEPVDIISGGFPCQPFSTAGQRRGAADDRHLWPAMRKVIKAVRPTWVVGENVAGLISMGLDDVLDDLEAEGYTTWPCVIPAAAVGAPHRRDRVWIIAHTSSTRRQGCELACASSESAGAPRSTAEPDSDAENPHEPAARGCTSSRRREQQGNAGAADGVRPATYALGLRELQQEGGEPSQWGWAGDRPDWSIQWPEVAARLCRVDDGLPRGVDRGRRLKCLGNAIVPQLAYQIFAAIKLTHSY